MQGEADRQRELLDVESLAGHLLPAGSVFAFLAEHRDRLFPASMFTDLFPSGRGRPSIPGEVVASVLVLQGFAFVLIRKFIQVVLLHSGDGLCFEGRAGLLQVPADAFEIIGVVSTVKVQYFFAIA